MATSLDATEVTVIRPTAMVSPTDYSHGPADNNDHFDPGGQDAGTDDNDFPGRG